MVWIIIKVIATFIQLMLYHSILQHSDRCCQVHLSDDILVPPGDTTVSHKTNDSNQNIDEVVHKPTAGERSIKIP